MKPIWLYILYTYISRRYHIHTTSLGRNVDSPVKHMRPHGKEA